MSHYRSFPPPHSSILHLEQTGGVQASVAVTGNHSSTIPFPRVSANASHSSQQDRVSTPFEHVPQYDNPRTIPFPLPSSAQLNDRPPVQSKLDSHIKASKLKLITLISLAAFGLAILAVAWYDLRPQPLLVLMVASAAFNLAVSTAEARWRLHAWRTPEASENVAWPRPLERKHCQLAFSLIVAARDEAAVIAHTLSGLVHQKHPYFEIIVSLCDDDYETIAAARTVAKRFPRDIKIVIDHYEKGSKAHQLNTALAECRGEVVGVFDAEDDVADTLLLHVEALFAESGADIVQGGVQLMNLGDRPRRWFQVHNVLEYYFWFTSRMAYQSDVGFVPLGGNTVFIYRDLRTPDIGRSFMQGLGGI